MAEFPAMPLFTDSYLADTRHLSTVEHGAYLLLLMEAWRRPGCSLPDDDRLLARLAGLSSDEWGDVREAVMAFFILDKRSKEWRQKRLSKERAFLDRKRLENRDKSLKRWNKTKKGDATAMPEGMPERCPDDAPTPTPTIEEERETIVSPKKVGEVDLFEARKSPRGTRLDPAWLPEPFPDEFIRETGLEPGELNDQFQRFRDYWLAKSGAQATKTDWQATLRNWLRKAGDDKRNRKPGRGGAGGKPSLHDFADEMVRTGRRSLWD